MNVPLFYMPNNLKLSYWDRSTVARNSMTLSQRIALYSTKHMPRRTASVWTLSHRSRCGSKTSFAGLPRMADHQTIFGSLCIEHWDMGALNLSSFWLQRIAKMKLKASPLLWLSCEYLENISRNINWCAIVSFVFICFFPNIAGQSTIPTNATNLPIGSCTPSIPCTNGACCNGKSGFCGWVNTWFLKATTDYLKVLVRIIARKYRKEVFVPVIAPVWKPISICLDVTHSISQRKPNVGLMQMLPTSHVPW